MVNKEIYHQIKRDLEGKGVELIAVSKTKPVSDLEEMYTEGCRVFGENKVQEMCDKESILPKDIDWHFIGHLQSNKVKYMASFVHFIHAIDSEKLLNTVNKEALKHERVIDVLIQFHIAEEPNKFGLILEEAKAFIETAVIDLKNVRIRGVMGMATFTDNQDQVRSEFAQLKSNFEDLKQTIFQDVTSFDTISMGMSGDYKIAIEEGSTMVRIGSTIFGGRA